MTTETIKVKPASELLAEEIYTRWRQEDRYRLSPLHAEWVVRWLAAALSALIAREADKLCKANGTSNVDKQTLEAVKADRDEWKQKAKRNAAAIASYHAQASHRARQLDTDAEKELKRQLVAVTDKLHEANLTASNLRAENERLRKQTGRNGKHANHTTTAKLDIERPREGQQPLDGEQGHEG